MMHHLNKYLHSEKSDQAPLSYSLIYTVSIRSITFFSIFVYGYKFLFCPRVDKTTTSIAPSSTAGTTTTQVINVTTTTTPQSITTGTFLFHGQQHIPYYCDRNTIRYNRKINNQQIFNAFNNQNFASYFTENQNVTVCFEFAESRH